MILDGHNDLALTVWLGEQPKHVYLEEGQALDFAGGFFALGAFGTVSVDEPPGLSYSLPLAPPVELEVAEREVGELATTLESLDVAIVRRVEEIIPGRVNAIMHFEGAEAIASDLSNLQAWYDRGLRSIGITWSRPNAFGEGVPFRFPASPDTGPGLTQAGKDLVRACNFLGVMVDVSHLNEAGFWDVSRHSQAPLVATHSNVHALSPSTRNLTDAQLDAIGASGGVVGINFGAMFLYGEHATEQGSFDDIVRHIDYIAKRIGVEHVAFGSDFEGADPPEGMDGIRGLPRLVAALGEAGYDEAALAKITHQNWLRVLGDAWRPWGRYFRLAGFDARPTLLDAVERFSSPGLAVDLGPGTGRDTAELLERGWRVIAIDREAEAIERLREYVDDGGGRLETQVAPFQEASWPECDLVNASYSLPFCPPAAFPALWGRIVSSIRPGGRFSGQFFGVNDDWARAGLTVKTRAQVEVLLEPFEVERLEEIDEEGSTLTGTKHWHLFHVVGRKR